MQLLHCKARTNVIATVVDFYSEFDFDFYIVTLSLSHNIYFACYFYLRLLPENTFKLLN